MPYTGKEVKTEATVTVDGIDEYDTPMQETWFSGDWDAGVYSYKSPLMGERGIFAQKQASGWGLSPEPSPRARRQGRMPGSG